MVGIVSSVTAEVNLVGINWTLLASWAALVGGIGTIILLVAWAVTGRRHRSLRLLAAFFMLITVAGLAYARFIAPSG